MLFFVLSNAQDSRIEKIDIVGNKRTKTLFLKRLAFVKEGTILDSVKIKSDVRRIKLLPAIANADYKIETIKDGKYHLTYIIEENFAIIPGLNISTDNNGDFAFRTSVFDFNFLGRNQLLGGFYSKNIFNSYGLYWEAPNLFTRKLGIGINYQNLISQEPIFFNNRDEANYKFLNKIFEIKLQYEPNFKNRLEIGLNIGLEDYGYIDGVIPNNIPLDLKTNKLAIVGEYEYNNINIFYQYNEGFRSFFTYRIVAGVNGENDFLRNDFIAQNDFNYFKRIGKKGNWANRLQLAYFTNTESPFAPYTVDNQLNIRGVGNTVDRGNAAIVFNTEYRHTLYEKNWFVIQGNAFIDSGTWRLPEGNFNDLFNGSTLRVYPGLGIRLIHKRIFNAVFRIDYGYGLENNATSGIAFGIGQYF